MTDEERQRQMDFILEQQAQLTATVGKLSVKVDRTADSVNALLAIAEIHEREVESLKDSQVETNERLNALINTVERYIGGREQA
jgi:hypothetical protein